MKKRFLIPLVLALSFTAVVMIDEPNAGERTECVVQAHQVVINVYHEDKLFTSTAFASSGFKNWQKGRREIRSVPYSAPHMDFRPLNSEGYGTLYFVNDFFRGRFTRYWNVPYSCYDAIRNIRSL